METLKYKVIKSKEQYDLYCAQLEFLIEQQESAAALDEIELLTFLIEKYDDENSSLNESDPVSILTSLMQDHNLRSRDLVEILSVSKGYVSDILHYRKGLSKEVIRRLAEHFNVNQKAFNRPYQLINNQPKNENVQVS